MLDGGVRSTIAEVDPWLPFWLEDSLSLNAQLFPQTVLTYVILVLHSAVLGAVTGPQGDYPITLDIWVVFALENSRKPGSPGIGSFIGFWCVGMWG